MHCWIRCWRAAHCVRKFPAWKSPRPWGRRASPPGTRNPPRKKPAPRMIEDRSAAQAARQAPLESIPALLSSPRREILDALIENPCLNETHICQLLERKDLAGSLIEEIAKCKAWRGSY